MLRPSSPWPGLLATAVAALAFALPPAESSAQTVRFLTSVGDFYMELNPENNPDLQGHVDNILAYIGSGRYHDTVLNRAPDGFVLQMGGFDLGNYRPSTLPVGGFDSIEKYDDVIVDADGDGQVDFDTLSNTEGTVALALQSGQPNSGTSSFFVSLTDNSFLDSQGFVPFAQITDMSDLAPITGANKVDLSNQVGQPGSLAYTDVPLTPDGEFIILESIMVVSNPFLDFAGPIRNVSSLVVDGAELLSTDDDSSDPSGGSTAPGGGGSSSGGSGLPATGAPHMPEPTAALLGMMAGAGVLLRRRQR